MSRCLIGGIYVYYHIIYYLFTRNNNNIIHIMNGNQASRIYCVYRFVCLKCDTGTSGPRIPIIYYLQTTSLI